MRSTTIKILLLSIPFLIGASSCEKMPDHQPCMVHLSDNTCAKYRLVDKQNLKYAFDSWQPMSYLDGGFGMPKGQMEKLLDYVRNNQCDKANAVLQEEL
jgi:hypothetical protein